MLEKITIDEIKSASERLVGIATRTPLVRLNYPESDSEIYLKLENLQPIGSFKLRGAYNAIAMIGADELAKGVSTSSAGNMAQGVAWSANKFGVQTILLSIESKRVFESIYPDYIASNFSEAVDFILDS